VIEPQTEYISDNKQPQNDDLFEDVVTDSPARASKRVKTEVPSANGQGDDDLFDDFGEYDKVRSVKHTIITPVVD
jgi:hypothetical protein